VFGHLKRKTEVLNTCEIRKYKELELTKLHITTIHDFISQKKMPKAQLYRGIFVTCQHKGWMCNKVLKDWLAVVWNRRPGMLLRKQGMLVSDI
jgi:hypothetical protein